MGLIYRKSKKIAPGVRLNFSKNGLSSVSLGGKGGRMTFGSKRTTTSVHIPGTSMRYQSSSAGKHHAPTNYSGGKSNWGCATIVLAVFLFAGFLMGGNPDWAIGSVATLGLLYFILSGAMIRLLRKFKS